MDDSCQPNTTGVYNQPTDQPVMTSWAMRKRTPNRLDSRGKAGAQQEEPSLEEGSG